MRRSTLAAAAILAALGAYIFWFERGAKDDTEGEPVFDVQKEAIDRIEIRAKGKDPVVAEKKGDAWELTAPLTAKADASEIDLLLQNLSTMRFDRTVGKASEGKLPDFGLDSPGLEVLFRVKAGKERKLDFGKDAPTTSHQYARRDGSDEILVLRSHLSLNFDKSSWDLRDKSVFPGIEGGSESEARRVSISRPAGKLVLESDGGAWKVTEPLKARADRYRVSSLVSRIRTAKMSDVVSETAEGGVESYGLAEPSRQIRVEPPEGADPKTEPLELSIGSKKDDAFYARTPARPQVFLVSPDLVEELDRAVSEFESKKLFEFSTFDAGRFRIEKEGAIREFVSKKSDAADAKKTWREVSPAPGRDLDTAAVEDFLYKLNGTEAAKTVESPDLGKLGLDEPAFVMSVWSKEPEIEETLRVSKPADGSVYAIRDGDSIALELSTDSWNGIEALMTMERQKKEETTTTPTPPTSQPE